MTWSDQNVRREAAKFAIAAMTAKNPVTCSVVDDTGFIKQGRHSVGVQRQYTGSAGKVTNCQLGVSLSVATAVVQLPLDMQLYLPESWTESKALRKKCRIPDAALFKTKPEMASDMIESAVADGISLGVILADCAFGNSKEFRRRVRLQNLTCAVAVKGDSVVYRLDDKGRRREKRWSLERLSATLDRKAFRRVAWREGTQKKLESSFYFERVAVTYKGESEPP